MTKVKNNSTNPHFLREAGDYLVANGYTRTDGELVTNTLYFYNGQRAVVVYNDHVDFMIYHDEEKGQRRAGYHQYHSFTSIGDLDLFKWMLLFHITEVVPMEQFMPREKREVSEGGPGFLLQVFEHFRTDKVPVNY